MFSRRKVLSACHVYLLRLRCSADVCVAGAENTWMYVACRNQAAMNEQSSTSTGNKNTNRQIRFRRPAALVPQRHENTRFEAPYKAGGTKRHEKARKGTKRHEKARKDTKRHEKARKGTKIHENTRKYTKRHEQPLHPPEETCSLKDASNNPKGTKIHVLRPHIRPVARKGTKRHEKARKDTKRHEKARKGTKRHDP